MELATIAGGAATAWLANKAAQSVGIDLTKVATTAVDEVAGAVKSALKLPANSSIGRIINTIA
ncbi:hypothetical protein [Herbaspirillum sp. YR522]|uniref:hypothetical protein n=1 Tax=Herbaspirillum sp. YR522 TaxID=1144342 RepID=UPI00026F7F85|nr:hypothetical protein [Herbaspirillum sp. YR522]EJN06915.1 hypothetical protein PMI40_02100 [Herbaspirillum sp. YR522]